SETGTMLVLKRASEVSTEPLARTVPNTSSLGLFPVLMVIAMEPAVGEADVPGARFVKNWMGALLLTRRIQLPDTVEYRPRSETVVMAAPPFWMVPLSTVRRPFTSSVLAGAVVPMPTLPPLVRLMRAKWLV